MSNPDTKCNHPHCPIHGRETGTVMTNCPLDTQGGMEWWEDRVREEWHDHMRAILEPVGENKAEEVLRNAMMKRWADWWLYKMDEEKTASYEAGKREVVELIQKEAQLITGHDKLPSRLEIQEQIQYLSRKSSHRYHQTAGILIGYDNIISVLTLPEEGDNNK